MSLSVLRQSKKVGGLLRQFSALPAYSEPRGEWVSKTGSPTATSGTPRAPFSYDPPGKNHLFVPGPVNIPDSVLRAMHVGGQNHRDPFFAEFYKACLEEVKMIFETKKDSTAGTSIIWPGTGTGGWEAALTNTLNPGDKVVTFRYGMFSHLWIDMMQRLGLDVEVIDCRWGDGADEARLADVLKADVDKKIKAVCVVHNETTTGVTSDVGRVRETMDAYNHPAMFLVDGVSSIGALDFEFDRWGVDVAVTGSQKALSLPTGLAVVMASEKAIEASKKNTSKRVYYDFADMLRTNPSGNVPYTPELQMLYGMRESLRLMRDEGMENVVARHNRFGCATRRAVKAWGLETLCKDERWKSDSLTVIETPEGVDSQKIVDVAYAKYNLSLGIGLDRVKGKVFRIGHLGSMNECMLLGALSGVEMAMKDVGMNIELGSGVAAASTYLNETSAAIPTREHMLAEA